jgi:hypothetical protein
VSTEAELAATRAALWALARSTATRSVGAGPQRFRLRFRSKEDAERLIGVEAVPLDHWDALNALTGIPITYDPDLDPDQYELDLMP